MRKLLKLFLFIPAVFFTGLFGFWQFALQTFGILWTLWMVLLWTSAILMSKGKLWGVLPGLLPAIDLIIMGSRNPDPLVLNEQWIGWPTAVYVLLCGLVVGLVKLLKKKRNVPVKTQ